MTTPVARPDSDVLSHNDILTWLLEQRETRLEALWAMADGVRAARVGDVVHLRGLLEISNCCDRECHYCGIRAHPRGRPWRCPVSTG